MKKLLIFALIAVIFSACEKKEKTILPTEVDVSFGISEMMDGGLKDGIECPTNPLTGLMYEPATAEVTLHDGTNDFDFVLDVFRLDGQLYTQTIKLDVMPDGSPKTYYVKKFVLKEAGGLIIMASPELGSEYAAYVNPPVGIVDPLDESPFSFEVSAFEKIQIDIEVICFLPGQYQYFGFMWFTVTEMVIREFCVFGDLCLNGEPYYPQDFILDGPGPNWGPTPGIDLVAIMRVSGFKGGIELPNSPITNWDETAGEIISPLCIKYPDLLLVENESFSFHFEFWIPDASGVFGWQTIFTLSGPDDLSTGGYFGDDNIMDFVFGTCGDGSADFHFDWPGI